MTPALDTAVGGLRLQEIHSFVVLAEELHFANAARRLLLSPGGLSRRITHLERVLGVRVLHRTTRTVQLTPYGRHFLRAVRPLVDELTAVLEAAPAAQRGLRRR